MCGATRHVRFVPEADIPVMAKIPKFLALNSKTNQHRCRNRHAKCLSESIFGHRNEKEELIALRALWFLGGIREKRLLAVGYIRRP